MSRHAILAQTWQRTIILVTYPLKAFRTTKPIISRFDILKFNRSMATLILLLRTVKQEEKRQNRSSETVDEFLVLVMFTIKRPEKHS